MTRSRKITSCFQISMLLPIKLDAPADWLFFIEVEAALEILRKEHGVGGRLS